MGDGTSIEWTDASWVMIAGCDHVSEGCGLPRWDDDLPGGCYAAKLTSGRLKRRPEYEGLAEGGRFNGKVRLLEHRLEVPLHWRKPRKIFVSDMADLLHKDVPDEFIAKVWAVMALCPQHIFQVLSKRHARMRTLLNSVEFDGLFQEAYVRLAEELGHPDPSAPSLPLPNVWVGVSVESQKWADIRIPHLLGTRAALRWISVEPLLGPLDLDQPRCEDHDRLEVFTDKHGFEWCEPCVADGFSGELSYGHWLDPLNDGIAWVVGGGESGPGARPMHPGWARTLRDQCVDRGVAYFHKQNGAYAPVVDKPAWGDVWVHPDGSTTAWDSDDGHIRHGLGDFKLGDAVLVRKVGKKAAGRLLDGRTWDEFPQPVEVRHG